MASMYEDPYETWKALGRPGGSFQAWQAQQGGGTAPAPSTPSPVAAGPGAFSQSWMDQGLAAYAQGQRGSDPLRTPGFDPATFRQQYAGMAGGNRPEDLARFSDATLAGWMPFYDPQQGKYRSMRGAEGWFDKPTECPPGSSPSGPSETDPCVPNAGGGQAQPVAAPAVNQPAQGGMDLTGLLAGLQGTANTGGFTGGSVSQPSNLAQTLAPLQSANQGLMRPAARPGGVQGPSGGQLGTGWNSTQGGLTDMLKQRQAKRPMGWF